MAPDQIISPTKPSPRLGEVVSMNMRLSTLWLFATLNYLYADVAGLMDHNLLRQYLNGNVGGLQMTQGFLLGAGILVEIPISMVLVSRVAGYRFNRWANIAAGAVMTIVQSVTLFVGSTATSYYVFFTAIEVGCTGFIVWSACRWSKPTPRNAP